MPPEAARSVIRDTKYLILINMPHQFYQDSIFWVELDKIQPNPYQPRKEFDEGELQSLADSIHQYGVLQALVVTRNEEAKEDGSGLHVYYELISGERRLRAAKLAGVKQVPVIIRTGDESKQMKLELAIIENVQREDLNVVDRARAFQRLIDEFEFSHSQVAKKVGKSREYITNSLRALSLPEYILNSLSDGTLSEGHARPLNMLNDRPQEQETLYKEIVYKKMSVREAERVARKIARDKTRKRDPKDDPKTAELEQQFSQSLGTRVSIERREQGGKLSIDFFSDEDLDHLLQMVREHGDANGNPNEMMERFIQAQKDANQASRASAENGDDQSRARAETTQATEPAPSAPSETASEAPTSYPKEYAEPELPETPDHAPAEETPRKQPVSTPQAESQVHSEPVSSPASAAPDVSSTTATETPEQSAGSTPHTAAPIGRQAEYSPPAGEPASEPTPSAEPASYQKQEPSRYDEPRTAPDNTEQQSTSGPEETFPSATPDYSAAAEAPAETTQQSSEPATPPDGQNKDDEDDLYSIRNFTV